VFIDSRTTEREQDLEGEERKRPSAFVNGSPHFQRREALAAINPTELRGKGVVLAGSYLAKMVERERIGFLRCSRAKEARFGGRKALLWKSWEKARQQGWKKEAYLWQSIERAREKRRARPIREAVANG